MRAALFVSMMVLALFASACSKDEYAAKPAAAAGEETASSSNLSPEQLGELGAQIKKSPEKAQELLSAHGLTQQSFEAAIREVTQDPEASKRYAAAFNKASA